MTEPSKKKADGAPRARLDATLQKYRRWYKCSEQHALAHLISDAIIVAVDTNVPPETLDSLITFKNMRKKKE